MKLEASIGQFIHNNHVLTLCIGNKTDLWCANCFYVFQQEEMSFIIMSDTNSRHGQLALQSAIVAGTINSQPQKIEEIQGIQYAGRIFQLAGEEAIIAREKYLSHFPTALSFNTPLWKIELDEVKMTDNTVSFAKKWYWSRLK